MIIPVKMLAFMDGEIRNVVLPDTFVGAITPENTTTILDRVFYYGQNDFQPVPKRCSVSVGDVAEINGEFWLCAFVGWIKISADVLAEYAKMERPDRMTYIYGLTDTCEEVVNSTKPTDPTSFIQDLDALPGHTGWDVFLNGRKIDKVFNNTARNAEDVRQGLVDHDGYDSGITVRRERRPRTT